MDADLFLSFPSALAVGHCLEVSLSLSGDRLDEVWTYRAEGFDPVSVSRAERFSSRGDALRRFSVRGAGLLEAAAQRADAPSPSDAVEDPARLAGMIGGECQGGSLERGLEGVGARGGGLVRSRFLEGGRGCGRGLGPGSFVGRVLPAAGARGC